MIAPLVTAVDPAGAVITTTVAPTISTQVAPTSATAGTPVTDQATLTGGSPAPSGTITFSAYGPSASPVCTTAVYTGTATVSADGTFTPSGPEFTPTAVGTYYWIASYSGTDGTASTSCGDPNESTTITQATPTISTTATTTATAGSPISDSASLSGAANPTGTITFTAYGPVTSPDTTTCTGTPAYTNTVPVGTGTGVGSGSFPPSTVGTYQWIATYNGDTNNAPATTACNDSGENTVVTQATPTVTTTPSSTTTQGNPISDSATVSGGANPTGTVSFAAYGPNDTSGCTATPAFTSGPQPLSGGNASSGDFSNPAPGTYSWVATYSGDANNTSAASTCGDETTIVQTAPTIGTTATPTATVGTPISDSATLTGAANPTGTITFTLYGPTSTPTTSSCTTPVYTNTVPVGTGTDVGSGSYTPMTAGTYQWIASYSGDTNNAAATTACNDSGENSTVNQATPSITTQATSSPSGGLISDTATLTNGYNPTGTITFNVYGSQTFFIFPIGIITIPGCEGPPPTAPPLFTSTVTVNGNGSYTSPPFLVPNAGSYYWVTSYSGDTNNAPAASPCGAPGETSTVSAATDTLATSATPTSPVGSPISDTATLTGGSSPTGTITFAAYGPNDANCTATPAFTSTATVNGNGSYPSGPFTPTAVGTYHWVATYGGDSNNAPSTSQCGDSGENTTVTQATPGMSTLATGTTLGSGTIADSATLSGGDSPTGTVTFTAYGPGDPTCQGTPVFAPDPVTVTSGNLGPYPSGPYTPTSAGTYHWTVVYSGDTNNAGTTSTCTETSVVQAVPTISTTASGTATVGTPISDSATLAGGNAPGGTITFHLYGPTATPSTTTCTTLVAMLMVTVEGNGNYSSGTFTPSAPGTYQWVASYGGDTNNTTATTHCNDEGENTPVVKAGAGITSTASGPVTLGNTISDSATVTNGFNPGGTLTFTAYGPGSTGCTGTVAFGPAAVTMNGGTGAGPYSSGTFTPTAAGTYNWKVVYSGDANNATATICNETSTVNPASTGGGGGGGGGPVQAPTSISTTASPSVAVGGTISDTATLAGGNNPTGTITFNVYGPSNSSCTGTPAFTSTKTVAGNGDYTSDAFTPTAAGTYNFTAAYGGDSGNAAASGACGAANESVTVTPAGPGPNQNVVAGPNRDQTAISASQLTFPTNNSAGAVILARNDLFADSLPGSRLATAKNGPLLLTPPTSLDPGTEAEIRRVLPAGGTVYILGGTDAISSGVEAQLRADGFNIVRDGGLTRFETAVLIAQSDQQAGAAGLSTPSSPIFVATGLDFPDGLTAGVAASAVNGVVLLSVGTQPSAATTQYIQSHPGATVYAVGGEAAAAYPNATPIVGATRYETAAALASRFFPSPTVVGIATGLAFPDALSGGAAMGKLGGPLLLTDPNTLSTATQQYLTAHKSTIKTDYIFGGSSAVSPAVRSQITAALS